MSVMVKKSANKTKKISNRRASHDYTLGDVFIVGIQLTGAETKALRMGHGQLRGAHVTIKDSELWLINATINGTNGIPISESDQVRSRKLLAKKRQIQNLIQAKQNNQSIVPLELLTGGRYIKLKIALGKGKKLYDKRQTIKAREVSRKIHNIKMG